jgi:hypothetical protein
MGSRWPDVRSHVIEAISGQRYDGLDALIEAARAQRSRDEGVPLVAHDSTS